MKIEAYAKINLTLEVLGKRADGYHALRSIVQPIALADTLEIEETDDGVIATDTGYGEEDLIVKAVKVLCGEAGVPRPRCQDAHPNGDATLLSRSAEDIHPNGDATLLSRSAEDIHPNGDATLLSRRNKKGLRIHVTKRIPAGGGLGGGSADAAAILLALNDLWQLGYTPEALADLGAQVGSDVPALVLAQHDRAPVLMEGRGERVSLLRQPQPPTSTSRFLILANPGVHSSTPAVFKAFVRSTYPSPKNDLESPAVALYPEIGEALAALRTAGAREVQMTGSGATVFGWAADESEAVRIAAEMKSRGYLAWTTKTL